MLTKARYCRITASFLLLLTTVGLFGIACHKKKRQEQSDSNYIISFKFEPADNAGLNASITARVIKDSIIIEVPATVQLANAVPVIQHTGASILPASRAPQNFNSPVIYTVIAENGSKRVYRTYLKVLSNSKAITSFIFEKANNGALVQNVTGDISGDTIRLIVPQNIDLSSLIPTISFTGVSMFPQSLVAGNFENERYYTVNAEDGSAKTYTVIVGGNKDVFIHGEDGFVYNIDAMTGSIKWSRNIGVGGSPVFDAGTVYVAGENSVVYALDAATGVTRWSQSPAVGNVALTAPVAKYGKVYFNGSGWLNYPGSPAAYFATFVVAFNAQSGGVDWFQTMSTGAMFTNSIMTNVAVSENVVCAYDVMVGPCVFDALTGARKWDRFGDMLGRTNPAINGNVIYYGMEGGIRAVDKETGTDIWLVRPMNNFSSPTIYNNTLFVTNGKNLNAIRLDGTSLWQVAYYTSDATTSLYSPLAGPGRLYVPDSRNQLGCYSATDGARIWLNEHCLSFPVLAGKNIYVASDIHRLICLNALTGELRWTANAIPISGMPCVVDYQGISYYATDAGMQN
jgi:outer membrane protein assembly factor BamB